jgi:hypothetical protein
MTRVPVDTRPAEAGRAAFGCRVTGLLLLPEDEGEPDRHFGQRRWICREPGNPLADVVL